MSLDLERPKICEDAHVAEAEPEEQQMVDENFTGNPYGLLPALVWLKISSKVQDTDDWLNLYFASSKLMDLLENDMIERIFPQVFSHLRKYLKRKDVINMCAADRKFETVIISWVQTRWLAPRWAGGGDNDPNNFNYYFNKIPSYSPIVTVESQEQIQLITNELLEGDNGSLIPFGIIFLGRWEGVQFLASVKTFLQLFGTCIWFCQFVSYEENSDLTQFLDIIIQCLKLIPNVIRLGLDVPYATPLAYPPKFLRLTKLKVLSLVHKTHTTFMDILRLHADQLEYLSIVGKHTLEESFQYSNLKKLRLTDFLMGRVPLRLDLFSQAILTKVYADISAYDFAEFGRMFLDFNKFVASLEDLELQTEVSYNDCYNREESDIEWAVNINLPKLKKFTIWGYAVGEHLLLRMISVQNRSRIPNFQHLFFIRIREREKIKEIFYSDIWSILSNLQEVKFGTSAIYTRDEYNEYHENPPNQ